MRPAGYFKDDAMYLVRWADYPNSRDSWVSRKDLNFVPDDDVPILESEPERTGKRKRTQKRTCTEEWSVFGTYFLPHIRYELRFGWLSRRTLTGRVRSGIASFCPPTVYERLLSGRGTIRKVGAVIHHTFSKAQDVPNVFVEADARDGIVEHELWGPITQAWWRLERPTGQNLADPTTGELHEEWELFVITSSVVFHYHTELFRLSVSFTYSHATRSELSPAWNTLRGPAVV